jgi:digeranylgeranylglycerophospholipid reductase
MIAPSYDVVIVGAGPSGSLCARNVARAGYSVLLCEKRPVVGVPVRCGEATGPKKRLSDFMTVSEDYIETHFTGVILNGPQGVHIRYDADRELGLMLDRRLFDQNVAAQAVAEGADLQVNARVFEVGPVIDGTRTVRIEQNGHNYDVRAKMVVGADGSESLTGRLIGIKSRQMPPLTCTAIELRIKAQDPNPNHLTFWQGHGSINRGYVWAFPKVKSGVVNLGSGELVPKLGAQTQFDLSMEFKNRFYPDAEVEEVHGGAVPVSGNLVEYTADRFLMCGDAAHHTNPLTGGGIMSGIVGGETAASWIDKGFKAGNLSAEFLKGYEGECFNRFGRGHLKEMRIRDFGLGLNERDQADFYRALKTFVDGKFSLPAKIKGYSQLSLVAARNFRHSKKVFWG